ncbi:MAG: ring-opening amidohydrolase [Nitrospinota bacterium]
MRAEVFRVAMASPDDVSGVIELIDSGRCKAEDIVCIMGKTEGNGCVNDFARGFSTYVLTDIFARRLGISRREVTDRIAMIMSGGTEGVMSPHFTVFARSSEGAGNGRDKRLAIASGHTRELLPEEIGRMAQVTETASEVGRLMKAAQIESPEDLHFVQVKTPLLTTGRIEEARERHQSVCTDNTYKSMAYSRAASALGIALATGEVKENQLSDEAICRDWPLCSGVASTSSGIELMCNEIMVVGNSPAWGGDLLIGHSVMQDAIDADAVKTALDNAGFRFEWRLSPEQQSRVVNVLAKCEASPDGRIRGRRHTMLEDSDINSTRHARCVVNAVIASIVGDSMVYVSGGAEHQGPPGGGPVAAIVRVA